ncbi:MAG: DUF2807 domain-containing protein [Ferruginibacter sp.]
MKKIIAIVTIASCTLISSCRKDSITGEGSLLTQQRSFAPFSAVQGNADIKIHVTYGTTVSTEVKGYRNLVEITETYVENGRLIIKYKDGYNNVRNSNVELYVVMPVLNSISTNGNGDAWIDGFQNGNSLEARINGSSNVNISNSSYDNVIFDVIGSGDIRAAGLMSKITSATIHGSGDIEIACSENLKARIYGSGDIRYWGNPGLDVQVSGNGNVTRQ